MNATKKINELRKADFTGEKVFVGIDVHNKTWNISIFYNNRFYKKFTTDDVSAIYKFLTNNFPNAQYYAAYEAGYCGFAPYRELTELGVNVLVVNPADVPTTDKEKQNKSDAVDSRKLAETLCAGLLHGIYVPSIEDEALRDLQRLRDSIVKKRTRIKCQIKSFLIKYNIKYFKEFSVSDSWSRAFIEYLTNIQSLTKLAKVCLDKFLSELDFYNKQLRTIQKQLKEFFNSPKFAEDFELLQSVPGIGSISAIVLLSEIIDINRFDNFDKLASYCGLAPTEHSSGETKRTGKLCKRRNARINTTLIESSWVAIRNDPALAKYYRTLTIKKMTATKAIIKVARKYLRKIMMVLKTKKAYVCGVA